MKKIINIFAAFIFLIVIVLGVWSTFAMQTVSFESTILMAKNKLKGDLESFKYMLSQEYGELQLVDDKLTDQHGNSIKYQYQIIDKISKELDIAATIFVKENDDYRRIATSIIDSSGKRGVDTFLGSQSAAFAFVLAGEEYIGNAVILGNNYLTVYHPLFQPGTDEVIGSLFLGINMKAIEEIIAHGEQSQLIRIAIVALSILLFLFYFLNHFTKLDTRTMIAEESNKAKSKFLATVSHEIRTPMNAILGITEIQLQDKTISAATREAFNKIYNSGNMLLGIINDILDLSRIEMDKMELNPIKYEIASLINDIVHLNIIRNSKPIEFSLKVDENTPATLLGDELRIKQILNNLLSNAYKYTERGNVILYIYTEAATEDDSAMLVFCISDTGQGMTAEQVKRLFTTEYTRFNLEANRTIEGIGLGLNITWRLIKLMNGAISVESEPNMGTSFIVRLPQKVIDSKAIGKEVAENLQNFRIISSANINSAQIMREYMPYGKILIVDDVDSNLYVAKGLMTPYGLSIDTVSSGFEAIEKIKAGNVYDIVFMDHMMPKMDGMEAAKIIRDMGYKSPIIVLTANAVVGQSKIFLENGFDEFIPKPIDIRQLNAVLNKFVRNKQPPEAIEEARRQKRSMAKSIPHDIAPELDALLSVFLLDIKKNLPIIESVLGNIENVSDEELQLFTVGVHAMKSAFANIGKTASSDLAFALEKATRARDKNAIKSMAPILIDELQNMAKEIEAKKQQIESDVDEDRDYLCKQLKTICQACESYDKKTIKNALKSLKDLSWKRDTQDLIDKIDEHILYSDFEEARKLAENVST
ncbi:MAG: Cache 3/Cache 2 fusion domain-containing protein [Fibromonadales bacterium]|nr:Cache 3/Cache 2 fusion domain-containing protein [Fibromonadales bacterium]